MRASSEAFCSDKMARLCNMMDLSWCMSDEARSQVFKDAVDRITMRTC